MGADDIDRIVNQARQTLDLTGARLGDEYRYGSLTLCVIDAVYSIGVRYESVQRVVARYCACTGLNAYRADGAVFPALSAQQPLEHLGRLGETMKAERLANEVFCNRQLTSTRNGILKADAVLRFVAVLRQNGIERFQDLESVTDDSAIEAEIRRLPGQRSGICWTYFRMLAGRDDLIKPDRMILRWLGIALGREVRITEAQPLLHGAVQRLKPEHPGINARLLDHLVWGQQRRTGRA
ncbi:hypothetical protein [Rubrivivax sp. JA1026]|uniref:hypothetical protein n=1 Tax=Rubrivivax sp. JA1026 TaxID=2710888 RepID=UPI00197EEFCA|nr:hypothetical protein [Rubrivivax sp. JA1026]